MGKKNSSKIGHGGFDTDPNSRSVTGGVAGPVIPTGGIVPGQEFLTASRGPRRVSPAPTIGMPPKVGNMMAPQNTNTGMMKVPEVGSGTVAGSSVSTPRAATPKPTVAARPFVHASALPARPRVGSGQMRAYLDRINGRQHPFTTNHGHGMSNCNYHGRDEE